MSTTPTERTWELRDDEPTVLFVTNMWPDSEKPVYGIFVKRQIASLRDAGISCDVLYVRGYLGIHVYLRAFAWFLLNQRALRARYALVHAHAGETALVISPLRGLPTIASYCGDDVLGKANDDGTFSRRAKLRRWLIAQSARSQTSTITKSREMAEVLPGSARDANFVVPNGINELEFRPMDRTEARRKLGWDRRERVVIFVATRPHEPRKRLDLARAAVAEAELIVGAVRLFVAENVAPSDLPTIMNAADCLILTSRMEGSPNAVKEALMCDLPVVSTDVGDVAELLSDVSLSVVARDDPAELGAALVQIFQAGTRSNGREKRAELKQSEIAKRIIDIYARAGYHPS
jgi:teichuronic acid biosynthesis glycosyltransferase TuaC